MRSGIVNFLLLILVFGVFCLLLRARSSATHHITFRIFQARCQSIVKGFNRLITIVMLLRISIVVIFGISIAMILSISLALMLMVIILLMSCIIFTIA